MFKWKRKYRQRDSSDQIGIGCVWCDTYVKMWLNNEVGPQANSKPSSGVFTCDSPIVDAYHIIDYSKKIKSKSIIVYLF